MRFKMSALVLVGRKMFQGMHPDCGQVSTRCAPVMRVVS